MKSKTKTLKKGTYTPGTNPAPVSKTEKNATAVASVNHYKRDEKKELKARIRERRIRSLIRKGMSKEDVKKLMEDENRRLVLCLIYGSYRYKDGDKTLTGSNAAEKFATENEMKVISKGPHHIWVSTVVDKIDTIVSLLKPIGRLSITKPEAPPEVKKKQKSPTNNTAERKKAAKEKRKSDNKKSAEMRPYYAAKRKGGVSQRIKKHNPELAKKIEAWLKERKKTDAKKAEKSKEYRAKHRQLTSLEMKANKRARKAAKHLATQERRTAREKERADYNAKLRIERAQKAQKPVQTEIKMAA